MKIREPRKLEEFKPHLKHDLQCHAGLKRYVLQTSNLFAHGKIYIKFISHLLDTSTNTPSLATIMTYGTFSHSAIQP